MKLCHRGITDYYPENTIGAINDTIISNKYDGIEIDIQLTKDNIWIIYHDDNLLRLTGVNINTNMADFEEINMIEWKGKKFYLNKLIDLMSVNVHKNFIFNIKIKSKFDINIKAKNNLKNILLNLPFKKFISSFNYEWYSWILENTTLEFAFLADKTIPSHGNFWIIDRNLLKSIDIFDMIERNIKIGIYGGKYEELDSNIIKYQIVDHKEEVIVYADGTFDLFHNGHIEFLKKAKSFGTKLYVGVLHDECVESYKRIPILELKDRTKILENIKIIDKVISPAPFYGSKFGNLDREFIQKNDIDIVVYSGDDLENWVSHYKTAIDLEIIRNFPYGKDNLSTSEIIERIKKRIK